MRLAGSGRALVAILLPEEPRPPPVPPPPQADFLAGQLLGPRPQCTSDWNNALKLGYDVQRLRYPDWLGAGATALGLAPDALPAVVRPSQAFVWRAVRRGGRFGEGGGRRRFPSSGAVPRVYPLFSPRIPVSAGSASQHFGVIFLANFMLGLHPSVNLSVNLRHWVWGQRVLCPVGGWREGPWGLNAQDRSHAFW